MNKRLINRVLGLVVQKRGINARRNQGILGATYQEAPYGEKIKGSAAEPRARYRYRYKLKSGTMTSTIRERRQQVADYLKTQGRVALRVIAAATGLSRSSVHRHRQSRDLLHISRSISANRQKAQNNENQDIRSLETS